MSVNSFSGGGVGVGCGVLMSGGGDGSVIVDGVYSGVMVGLVNWR